MKSKTILIFLFIAGFSFSQNLEGYLKIAVENNPELKAAYATFEAAMQQVPQASSLPDPVFSFSVLGEMAETRVGQQQARFSLMQQFPWFGTLTAKKDVASSMAASKFQEYLNIKNELLFKVKAAYYEVYELQETIKYQEENLKIIASLKELALSKFKNGKAAMIDVIRADMLYNDASTGLAVLKTKQRLLAANFNTLLNRDIEATVNVSGFTMADILPVKDRGVELNEHPLVKMTDDKIASAIAQENVAVKSGLPKIGVGVEYGIVARRTDVAITDNGKDMFMPMVSVSLPIFRKKYKAAKKEASYKKEAYEHMKEAIQDKLIADYEETVFEMENTVQLMALYEKQIKNAEQSVQLLLKAYSTATSEFEELLKMQQQLLKYQLAKTTTLKKYHTAVANLEYLNTTSEK
ncbi:TolC family protein [Leptobacterium sp. I13]|uniref:TolC family protein n=1 Tax=Leptobacterium meishanense TaxID=3128904 RepID=UPI0030EF5245